ncbi:MAG: hypothetical protein MRZ84_10780 [Eubacterium sp.]|nr:hypothetical protein [Eubacterium sp.]
MLKILEINLKEMKKEWIIKTCVLFTTVLLMGCSGLDLGGKSIKKENENQFEGADDFYGEILSEEYERYIKEKLIDYKDDIKGLNVCFTQMQGEEIDESITIDKIFEKKMDVPLLSKIFIKVENQTREEMEELSAAVERIINQADIYGAYILYFVKEDDIISRGIEQNVLKHDDYVYKYSFQNFNQGGDENAGPE